MYIIIGGNSFLGSYIVRNILSDTEEKIIATYNSSEPFCNDARITWLKYNINNEIDSENLRQAIQNAGRKFKCIYLAGCIKPDVVERDEEMGYKTNVIGLKTFINNNKKFIECLYFSSTDMVFDSRDDDYKYKETDKTCPMNKYGMQKSECEKLVLSNGFHVFRCPLMYGRSLIPNRIHFIDHIRDAMTEGYEFEVLSDYYESSLDYDSVAKILLRLIKINNTKQIVNICADDKISKYQIAMQYAKKYKLNSTFIKPISLKDANFFVAKRGSVLLDNSLVKALLNISQIERRI